MKTNILTDTGFWIGLLDPTDQYSDVANAISDLIEDYQILFPWPCLYETLRTKYSKRRDRIIILEKLLKKSNVILINDSEYRDSALSSTFHHIIIGKSFHSLVDNVIREILSDINLKIDYLVTFNKRDFIDICNKRRIEILE